MGLLDGFMNPQTMGLLGTGASLLQAGGPSLRPTSFGQALGQGLMGGVQSYQQAAQLQKQELMTKLQMEKLLREKKQQEALAALYAPQAQAPQGETPPGMSPSTSMGLFGSPDMATPAQSPQASQRQRGPSLEQLGGLAATGYDVRPLMEIYKAQNPDPIINNGYVVPRNVQPGTHLPIARDLDIGGEIQRRQQNPDGSERTIGTTPKTGAPATLPFWLNRQNGVSSIDPVAYQGQQGLASAGANRQTQIVNPALNPFKNEKELRDEYRGNPVVKVADEMNTAFSTIETAFKKPSPANDLAMATKYMKILDPTSVVRESELALALNATGLIDRVRNYAEQIATGKKLNPAQRQDFYSSAKAINDAFQKQKESVATNYRGIAKQYGLKPENVTFNVGGGPVADVADDPLGIRGNK
jgi:hypothetical protein